MKSVLLEYESPQTSEIYTNSGILLEDTFLLIPSNVFIPYLKTLNLFTWFKQIKPGHLHFDALQPNSPRVKVVYRQNNNDQNNLRFRNAQVIAVFISEDILESCQTFFKDWNMNREDEVQIKETLSLFFILEIVENNSSEHTTTEEKRIQLTRILTDLLERRHQIDVIVGREIFIESVPFGNRAFLNSFSRGIVSNVVGRNGCFLLTDCPAAPGSEGGSIQIKTRNESIVIGILISCLNWWKGEWTGLTLGANLQSLLMEILKGSENKNILKTDPYHDLAISRTKKLLLDKINSSVIKVISRGQWGTGILIDKEKGIFITNSHVVENDDIVTVQWKTRKFTAEVIYATPNGDVFDLAILKVEPKRFHVLEMQAIEVAMDYVQNGEEVFAVGFSLFPEDLNIGATVTKGNVSHVEKYVIKTTCSVHAGASGGAIIRPRGELIGLIVCNMRLEEKGTIFPRINMAVPMATVFPSIRRYLLNEDIENLKSLHSNDPQIIKQWSVTSGKL